jgi:hypothetical protein
MAIGLHSVLRELFTRSSYPPYSHVYNEDADEVWSEREDSSTAPSMGISGVREGDFAGRIDDRDERSVGVQARWV